MDDLLKDAIVECYIGRNDDDGAMCKRIRDGKLYVCSAYIKMAGKDPQSGKTYDDWRCAMNWMPIIGVENSQTNRGQTQAIEYLRADVVKGNKVFSDAIEEARNASLPGQ